MRSGPLELQPAREFVQRMHELEAELQRARQAQRRLKADPDAPSRWGLETRAPVQQEEGWFLTYLDMMTLLLVAMIVMLAFSGGMMRRGQDATAQLSPHTPPAAQTAPDASAPPLAPPAPAVEDEIPAPDLASPYPAAPADAFEQSAYPSSAVAAMASAYPTPADLAPKQPAMPAPASDAPVPAPAAGAAAAPPSASGAAPAAAVPEAAAGTTPPPVAPQPAPSAANVVDSPPAASPPAAQEPALPAADAVAATPPAPAGPASPVQADKPVNAQSEGQSLAAALPLDELGSEIEVIVNKRSVSLRINNEILFGTGQADLSPHGLTVLKRMAEVLSKGGYDIMVEGHTDSVPVRNNGRYPSNWELSSARAGSVVRYLQANGIDKAHLRAVGYADTRPIASNQGPNGRALNRRVELVIEKPEASPAKTPDQAGPTDAPAAPGR